MKILHVMPSVSAEFGGPSRAIFELCASEIRRGITSEIATTCAPSEADYGSCANQTRAIDGVPTHFFKGSLGTYRYSTELAGWLSEHARDYDVFHIHSIFTHSTLAASRAAQKYGVPYIIRTQGILYPWCLNSIGKHKKRVYLALFEMKNLMRASRIHFTTEHERNGCAYPSLQNRSYVLPLGIQPVKERVGRETLDARFEPLRGRRILLCVSRLHPIKGLEIFLPAAADVLKQRPDWIFVIGGRGEAAYEERLKSLVRQCALERHVFFAGSVSGEIKQALFQNASAFALSSHSENFGMAILEAMQQGLPVAISDRVGLKEDVEKNDAGLIFSLDAPSIQATLSRLLDDAALRARLGESGRTAAASQFSWEHISEEQINIYNQILEENRA